MIVFAVNENENICIAELNRPAGNATEDNMHLWAMLKRFMML